MIALAMAATLIAAPITTTTAYLQVCASPEYHEVCPPGTPEPAALPARAIDNPIDWTVEVEALLDELCRQGSGFWNGTTCKPGGHS